jgi:hypothetical protein
MHGSPGEEEVGGRLEEMKKARKMSGGPYRNSRFTHLQSLSNQDKTQRLYGKLKGEIFCLIPMATVYVYGCTINIDTFLLLMFISVYTKRIFVSK